MSEKTYNGWTNYETWNVNLWMSNDKGSYRHYGALAQDAYDNAEAERFFTRLERATLDLSDMLKEEFEQAMDEILGDMSASVWADLLGAALSEVNWHEIAEHLIDDCDQEAETEEDA